MRTAFAFLCISLRLFALAASLAPATNKVHAAFSWDLGTNGLQHFLFQQVSNGAAVRSWNTTNTLVVVSNLNISTVWGSQFILSSPEQGRLAIWSATNYARALFATNLFGPWGELPATTWAYPPLNGFLRWTNFDNWSALAKKD